MITGEVIGKFSIIEVCRWEFSSSLSSPSLFSVDINCAFYNLIISVYALLYNDQNRVLYVFFTSNISLALFWVYIWRVRELGLVAHTFNSRTLDAEVSGSLSLRSAYIASSRAVKDAQWDPVSSLSLFACVLSGLVI